MQFNTNSNYPQPTHAGVTAEEEARPPLDFPRANPEPCARITIRVYQPGIGGVPGSVVTVQNVLVKTRRRAMLKAPQNGNGDSNSSDSSSDSDDSDEDSTNAMDTDEPRVAGARVVGSSQQQYQEEERAYWLQRTLREAIYGEVKFAIVLRRRKDSSQSVDGDGMSSASTVEWEVTNEACAVKELSWQHIQRESGHLAEDPRAEVSAMQYMKRYHDEMKANNEMMDNHVMMPMDLLTDDRNLYSIMPYCNGGELFDLLDERNRFPEEEARYWLHQILAVRPLTFSCVVYNFDGAMLV